MAGIDIVRADDAEVFDHHPIDGHRFAGAPGAPGAPDGIEARVVSPAGYSLWLVAAALADRTSIELPPVHGDEVVAVLEGELDADGRICPAGGAVVIESGASPTITARGRTRIVHMGPADPAVPQDGLNGPCTPGDAVHVVGPGGTFAAVDAHRDTHYFADSTCPTCRLTLLYTSRSVEYISAAHSHSQAELIHLLHGELRLGAHTLRPGDTLAVDADRRYGFRSGPDGFAFINYRRDASQQTVERGAPPLMEGGAVNGLVAVMDLR
ncbi:MAG TPA: hypothetical protein PLV68_01895 [Ilumatobacteraceae bacterium]|nr:hypothetical protein [Ilumatobacteraceae bacterium]